MFKLVVSGMLIGIANIIPGVSGATLAVITNQYQRIMTNAADLTSLKLKCVEWGYLACIAIAAVAGIYLLSWPLDVGLTQFNALTLTLITGLVIGSLGGVKLTENQRSIKSRYLNGWCLAGAVLVIAIGWLPELGGGDGNRVILHAVSGAVAMIAMLIPGVSGSMILVLLGTYADVVQLIKSMDVIAMLPFALGALTGGAVTVKGIQWMIQNFTSPFESFILGAVVGSVFFIANQIDPSSSHPMSMVVMLILGVVVSWRLTHAR